MFGKTATFNMSWALLALLGCDDALNGGEDAGQDAGSSPSRCELPFEAGPCEAAFPVYWFNAQRGACELKTYGGCDGNENRFETLEACQATCPPADDVACEEDSDCSWGEIGHEILDTADCTCLYGCPYIPLNRSTITRRSAQHQALCDPRRDGQGELCGIDDCIQPPPATCAEGRCTGNLHGD